MGSLMARLTADDAGWLVRQCLVEFFGYEPAETPRQGHPFWEWMRSHHHDVLMAIVDLAIDREVQEFMDEKVLAGECIAERGPDGQTIYRKVGD